MIPISELKQDLELNKSLGSIIETLKAGSSVQVREFQLKRRASDRLFAMLKGCFDAIAAKGAIRHPFFVRDERLPSCIIAVTSDDGFVGDLNSTVVNAALEKGTGPGDDFVVLGERGAGYFADRNERFVFFPGINEEIEPDQIRNLKSYIIDGYIRKRFGRAEIFYPESAQVGSWKVTSAELLPLVSISAVAGADRISTPGVEAVKELLVEPSIESVAEELASLWINVTLYNVFWESKFSEFGARLMHLEGSEQELARMKQHLSRQYFKHLHEQADKTIRELLSARMSLGA